MGLHAQRLDGLHRIVPVLVAALLAACGSLMQTEEDIWAEAVEMNRTGSHGYLYERYLRSFPEGPHAPEARQWLVDDYWKRATTDGSYAEFLAKAPRPNAHEAEAKYQVAMRMLPDRAGTERCVLGNESCTGLREFLRDYPDTDKAREVSGWVAEFEVLRDDRDYRQALDGGTYFSLLQYLASYPDGRHRQAILAEVARYRFETLTSPLTFSWQELGIGAPLVDDVLGLHMTEERMRAGIVVTGCVPGNQPVAIDRLQIAAAGASLPGAPDITPVRGTLSATTMAGIAQLELEPGHCIAILSAREQYIGVGSRFRIREVKDAGGNSLPLLIHGQLVRQGGVAFLQDGVQFSAKTVLLRRAER